MPRPMRIEYPGAIFHVLSRGDRREPIFLDDGDCQDFVKNDIMGLTGGVEHLRLGPIDGSSTLN